MSNSIVAIIYSQIMKDVVSNVQKDFEENGIDLAVLQDLEKMWESRVANTNVANFDHMGGQPFGGQPQSMSLDNDNLGNGPQAMPIPGVEEYASYYDQSYGHPELSAINYNPMMMGASSNQYAAANLANLASHHSMGGMSNQMPSSLAGSNANQNMVSNSHYAQHYQHSHQAQMASYGGHMHSEYTSYSMSNLTHQDMYNNNVNQNSEYPLGTGTDPYRPTGPPQLDGASDALDSSIGISKKEADRWLKSRILGRKLKPIPQVDGEDDDLDNDADLDAKLEENDEVIKSCFRY
ncbi:transcription factor IIA subunit alpha, variant 2 [Entomophthora muscae]|uniref:Transcription factor IIA subunit alpha, variant 2 n=1 Tax=Entomophthora muscae TaxID=34485 RepID=A0ACC2SMK5_9FUNG|nr:transcription factor IIA subunit alpha, variant 2 [Entomophthora muscae]